MADPGFDPVTGSPLLPQEYQALQGQQLSRLGLQDTPTGPFGALARVIAAGRGGGMTQDALSQISDAYQGAWPSIARAYGSADPYGTIANDPNATPVAKWTVFRQTPEQIAAAKLRLASAGLVETETGQARLRLGVGQQLLGAGGAPSGAGAPTGYLPSGQPVPATGEPAASAAAPFVFPGRITPAATAASGAGTAGAPAAAPGIPAGPEDVLGQAPAAPEQRQAYLKALSPTQLFRLRQQLALRQLQQQAAAGGRAG